MHQLLRGGPSKFPEYESLEADQMQFPRMQDLKVLRVPAAPGPGAKNPQTRPHSLRKLISPIRLAFFLWEFPERL